MTNYLQIVDAVNSSDHTWRQHPIYYVNYCYFGIWFRCQIKTMGYYERQMDVHNS